jgi:hypothetical protein
MERCWTITDEDFERPEDLLDKIELGVGIGHFPVAFAAWWTKNHDDEDTLKLVADLIEAFKRVCPADAKRLVVHLRHDETLAMTCLPESS